MSSVVWWKLAKQQWKHEARGLGGSCCSTVWWSWSWKSAEAKREPAGNYQLLSAWTPAQIKCFMRGSRVTLCAHTLCGFFLIFHGRGCACLLETKKNQTTFLSISSFLSLFFLLVEHYKNWVHIFYCSSGQAHDAADVSLATPLYHMRTSEFCPWWSDY